MCLTNACIIIIIIIIIIMTYQQPNLARRPQLKGMYNSLRGLPYSLTLKVGPKRGEGWQKFVIPLCMLILFDLGTVSVLPTVMLLGTT